MNKKMSKCTIEQLLAVKSRQMLRVARFEQTFRRIHAIDASYAFVREWTTSGQIQRKELLKYIPIGLVACLQGYASLAIRDLIDHGPPYVDNIRDLKDFNLKMDTLIEILKRNVKLGEVVSHTIKPSSLKDYFAAFDDVIGESLSALIKNIEICCPHCGKFFTMGKLASGLFANVQRTFELRHIFSHELALKHPVRIRQIKRCLEDTGWFLVLNEIAMDILLNERPERTRIDHTVLLSKNQRFSIVKR